MQLQNIARSSATFKKSCHVATLAWRTSLRPHTAAWRCARSRCRKTSLVAPASLWPRYFSPNRSIHACSASASSGSSQMTQSASPARSRKLRHSHKLRMATFGRCPAAISAPRAARRSRVQKWPARSSPSHSRQLPNSGTADSRRSDLKRGRRRSASSHWKTLRAF